jgi:hypothetical protein
MTRHQTCMRTVPHADHIYMPTIYIIDQCVITRHHMWCQTARAHHTGGVDVAHVHT